MASSFMLLFTRGGGIPITTSTIERMIRERSSSFSLRLIGGEFRIPGRGRRQTVSLLPDELASLNSGKSRPLRNRDSSLHTRWKPLSEIDTSKARTYLVEHPVFCLVIRRGVGLFEWWRACHDRRAGSFGALLALRIELTIAWTQIETGYKRLPARDCVKLWQGSGTNTLWAP